MAACYLFGEYETKESAQNALRGVKGLIDHVELVSSKVLNEYWVLIPPQVSWQASLKKVETLKAQGVKDLWLVPSGDNKGAISLGLFVDHTRAKKQLAGLMAKAINAKIVLRSRMNYHLKVRAFISRDALNNIFINKGRGAHYINIIAC